MTESMTSTSTRPAGSVQASTARECLVYFPDSAAGDAVREYARCLHSLLGLEVCYRKLEEKEDLDCIGQESAGCELMILGEPAHSRLEALLPGQPCAQAIAQSPTSVLLARQPRWPVENILLILRIEKTDEAAVDWLIRLVHPSETVRDVAVTILPLVPSVPAMYSVGQHVQIGLDVLLSPNTPSGHYLRYIAQQLAQRQIKSNLHLRQGNPDRQIRDEVAERSYDLVLIGAEPHGRLYRLMLGEIVTPMLRWIDQPLLIARPLNSEQ